MNCIEFRRDKLADPRRLSADAAMHAQGCGSCAAFARSVDATDASIQQALMVPVPEGLADRVLLSGRGAVRSRGRVWAMAAGFVAAIAATTFYVNYLSADEYARLAIEHVVHEPESLTTVYNAGPESVEAALRSVGATARVSIGQVRYVRLCPLQDGGTGWHIVFDAPQGLATLIVVPNKLARSTSETTAGGWSAFVQPVSRGYYAVITPSATMTARVGDILRQRVNWNS